MGLGRMSPGCNCCEPACNLCYDGTLPGNRAIQVTISGVVNSELYTEDCDGVTTQYPRWDLLNGTYILQPARTSATEAFCKWSGIFILEEFCACGVTIGGGQNQTIRIETIDLLGTATAWLKVTFGFGHIPICITGAPTADFTLGVVDPITAWSCDEIETGILTEGNTGLSTVPIECDLSAATALIEFPGSQTPQPPAPPTITEIAMSGPGYSVFDETARIVVEVPPATVTSSAMIGFQYDSDGTPTWTDPDYNTQANITWMYGDSGGHYSSLDLIQTEIPEASGDSLTIRPVWRPWWDGTGTEPAWEYGDPITLTVWDGTTNCADYHEHDPDVC